jgi:hypothetical protein
LSVAIVLDTLAAYGMTGNEESEGFEGVVKVL